MIPHKLYRTTSGATKGAWDHSQVRVWNSQPSARIHSPSGILQESMDSHYKTLYKL